MALDQARRVVAPGEILSISVFLHHDIVDGTPVARFANRPGKRIEKAQAL